MALRKKKNDDTTTASSKTAKAPKSAKAPKAPGELGKFAQFRAVLSMTRKRDPRAIVLALAGLLGGIAIGVVGGLLLGPIWLWAPLGLLTGFVIAMNIFSRRVQRTAYAEMEGQPGVAAGIVDRMRGDWRLTPAVQVNRNSDVVHRVVGRPGIILIAEGRGRGPRDLLANEVRRLRRVVGDVPIHDIVVGNGEGEVPLAKLQSTVMKMGPRTLRKADVATLERRLRAVGGANLPIPKGPMPRNIPRSGKIR